MKAIIFAGGVGTRLWPLSRRSSPKQFEKVIGDKSTLQLAAERIIPCINWEDIYVATSKRYVRIIREQLPKLPDSNLIAEPESRDVGPAVGLVLVKLLDEFPNEPIVILWSDHMVRKSLLFCKTIQTAGETSFAIKQAPDVYKVKDLILDYSRLNQKNVGTQQVETNKI